MAKNQNTYEKSRREMEKKRKAEEKRAKRQNKNKPPVVEVAEVVKKKEPAPSPDEVLSVFS